MSFRKRNIGLLNVTAPDSVAAKPTSSAGSKNRLPGTRPSPVDGRSTTSTGLANLDDLLAGHGGLPLGCSIIVEENGTTDYSGAIVKFFAAEGLVQGHHLHVVGPPEPWTRELPGLVCSTARETERSDRVPSSSVVGDSAATERMKIAWRYESLGSANSASKSRDQRGSGGSESSPNSKPTEIFCHTFDLSKRLVHPPSAQLSFYSISTDPSRSPFQPVLERLLTTISNTSPTTIHRIVIPSLLSPTFYPSHSPRPEYILQFVHGLGAILSTYSDRATLISTLPSTLFPRITGLVRWIEILSDTVIELTPFPHSADASFASTKVNGPGGTGEDPPQGLLKVHKLPILHERGVGNNSADDDWTFSLSRRKLTIKPFNLPPLEGDSDAQQAAVGGNEEGKAKKSDMDF